MKIIKSALYILSMGILLAGCSSPSNKDQKETTRKPNIILVMADDLGYGDLGCFGQKDIKTPNLDKMAMDGVKFNSFYSGNTVCAPSRCSLMTGRHMGHSYVRGNDPPGSELRFGSGLPIRAQDTVISELMKTAGYMTGMFGKWGLGVEGTSGAPHLKGWDSYYGFLNQADAHKYYYDNLWEVKDGTLRNVDIDTTDYTHELIMDKAYDFISENKDTTFFLYVPMALPHAELWLPQEDLSPYLDENGKSTFEEAPFEGDWLYRKQDNPNAAYAGMVSRMDKDMGKLFDLLKTLNIDNNTLVIFTSDNGPHHEGGYNPEYFNSNGPYRGAKRDLYEGGIRVPTIARWPGSIPKGSTIDEPYASWDFLPTFGELAGYNPPKDRDGVSLLAAMKGQKAIRHEYLYWEFYLPWEKKFTQAVRKEKWKALRYKVGEGEIIEELYDLDVDPGEVTDLAKEHPELLLELVSTMKEASERPNSSFMASQDFMK